MKKEIFVESVNGALSTKVHSGKHELFIDEPTSSGGADLGPDPYEMILSSLGACTIMTLHLYAQRKKWPLKKVEVLLTYNKSHSEDSIECEEDEDKKLNHIERKISLQGNLSDAQIEQLDFIAHKCPIYKTLEPCVHIETITSLAMD